MIELTIQQSEQSDCIQAQDHHGNIECNDLDQKLMLLNVICKTDSRKPALERLLKARLSVLATVTRVLKLEETNIQSLVCDLDICIPKILVGDCSRMED